MIGGVYVNRCVDCGEEHDGSEEICEHCLDEYETGTETQKVEVNREREMARFVGRMEAILYPLSTISQTDEQKVATAKKALKELYDLVGWKLEES